MGFQAQLKDQLRRVYHRLSYPFMKRLVVRNRDLKDRYRGERCFVLCTGASLLELDLSKLAGEKAMACNRLYLHPQFGCLNLVAYFEMDSARTVFKTQSSYQVAGRTEHVHEYFRDLGVISAGKPWPMVMSAESAGTVRKRGLFKRSDVRYLKCFATIKNATTLSNDMAGKFTFSDGVVYAMIASAIYMGFKEIYLVGSGYTLSPFQSGHFYDGWSKTSPDTVDIRHSILNRFATERGVRVFNVAPEGFASPVYERISAADLYKAIGVPLTKPNETESS